MRIGGAVGVMQLVWIDEDDEGSYNEDRLLPYDSRKQAAEEGVFTASFLGDYAYRVQRSGGAMHDIEAARFDGVLAAGCNCYDFDTYGRGFVRACQHIWVVVLRFDIEEY